MTQARPDESNLISRSATGDQQAFRQLVLHYQGLAFGCARGITRNDADAKDAVQEAFIRLYRNIAQVDPNRPLKPYFLTIVANCSRTLVVRKQRQTTGADIEDTLAKVPDEGRCPAGEILHEERKSAVRQLIDDLPQTMREVCSLFYLGECSCREVAGILKMSESAVKVALHRARIQLRSGAKEWRIN